MTGSDRFSARAAAVLAAAVVTVSFSAIFVRLATAPALIIAAGRLIIATLIILPPAIVFKKRELRRLGRVEILLAFIGGLFLAGHFYYWIASLQLTTVAHSVLFVSTHPIFVLIASRLFFGEKISPAAFFGSLVALAGIVMISGGGFRLAYGGLPGDFMALTGAVMMAGYLLVGRALRPMISTLSYTVIVYGTAALMLTAGALLGGIPFYPYPCTDYLLFAALAVIPTIFGHSIFNWALNRYSATLVSLLFLGEPIGAAVLAWLIFREQPEPFFFPGAALVLAGLAVVIMGRARCTGPGGKPTVPPR